MSDSSTTVSGAIIPGSNLEATSRRFSPDSVCRGISESRSMTKRLCSPTTASGIRPRGSSPSSATDGPWPRGRADPTIRWKAP